MERFYGARPFATQGFYQDAGPLTSSDFEHDGSQESLRSIRMMCICLTLTWMGFRKRSNNKSPGEAEFPLSEFWADATIFLVPVSGGRLAKRPPADARGSVWRGYARLRQPGSPGNTIRMTRLRELKLSWRYCPAGRLTWLD